MNSLESLIVTQQYYCPLFLEMPCLGCAACCHRMIEVTEDEAFVLLARLRKIYPEGIPGHVIERLRSQAKFEPHQGSFPFF